MNGIQGIGFGADMGINTVTKTKATGGAGFDDFFKQAIANVAQTEATHDANTAALMAGEINDISQVTIAAEKFTTSVTLLTTIRDKAVEAYQEIMRMQV